MKGKYAIALVPLLAVSAVTVGCASADGPPSPQVPVNNALACDRVVDDDDTGYLGGPLTAGRAVTLLSNLQRPDHATAIARGTVSPADRSRLDLMAVELIGYSGSRLSDDAAAFAQAEVRYSPDDRPVDVSFARPLAGSIAALARDCPPASR